MSIEFNPTKLRAYAQAIAENALQIRDSLFLNSSGSGNTGFDTTRAISQLNDEISREITELADSVENKAEALHAMANSYTRTEDEASDSSTKFFPS